MCHTGLHPATERSVRQWAPQAELIDVTGDDYGYWREIRKRWTGETDLILIEQDIEILPDSIQSMAGCEHDWCCYAYTIFRNKQRLRYGLGCTKFSARAQRLVNARRIAEGFALCKYCKGQGCWYHLDGRIAEILKLDAGLSPHVHGDVTHHHDYGNDLPVQAPGEANELLSELIEVRGRAIEHYDENWDPTPAVVLGDYWPRREMYALTPRLATEIAADLERLLYSTELEPYSYSGTGGEFATDKVMLGYLPTYTQLAKRLGPAARVCEVGVLDGGSLDMWRALFPQGTVAGVDINPQARWPDGTVRIVAAQDDPGLPRLLDSFEEAWDLIVDDASHDGRLTEATFRLLWPLVSPGGYYVIEDWFTGFAGAEGYDDSMLVMARGLLDHLSPYDDGHLPGVEAVEYRHGMAILRKTV